MRRIYEWLLGLYPPDLRTPFAPEMAAVFVQVAEDRRKEGWSAFAGFVLAEFFGLLRGAAAAHRAIRTSDIDLTKMRPPGVRREAYVAALDEVREAERLVEFHQSRIDRAISRNDFDRARFHADERRKAHQHLRLVRRKYGIPKAAT